MGRVGAWVVTLVLSVGALVGVPSTAGAGTTPRPPTDFITLDSAEWHYPGHGQALSWTGEQIIDVYGGTGGLQINASESGSTEQPYWTWTLRPAAGGRLDVGDYVVTPESVHPQSQPSIELGGDGRGCNQESGRFRILELAPDLSRVWILYEHRCEGSGDPETAAWGEIRIGMPDVGTDLMLLPDALELPDWYPGLDAVAQPVMVFNTGDEPLMVTDAAVTAGHSDFRVTGGLDSCAELAPRESCRVFVGFRPAAAGDRTGVLRLTTSAGTRDLRLSGYGYPGLTEFRLRGGGTESYVMTPGAWTMGGSNYGQQGLPERSAGFFASEPGYNGDWIDLRFTAPEEGFRAGRTYAGCCTDVGPSMGLGITGRGYRPGGTYTVHEVAYDDEGSLERFSASFRMHVGGWYVGTIAWRARAQPPMPAIPSEGAGDPLAVATDRADYKAGDVAQVTVSSPAVAGEEVTLYAEAWGHGRVVGTKRADLAGRVEFQVPLTNEQILYAASGAHSGYATVAVEPLPVVVARASGRVGRQGRFLLFRSGRPVPLAAAATPVVDTECLYQQVQLRRSSGWRPASTRCLRVQDLSVARSRIVGRAGERKRVRFVLPAAGERPTAASAWIYAKFVRRPA